MSASTTTLDKLDQPHAKRKLFLVCLLYLLMSAISASSSLDTDEFTFIREPYELLGGDYTVGYLKERNYADAVRTIFKSYYLYWNYRPLFSPLISEADKRLFAMEELKFGYTKPASVSKEDPDAQAKYAKRLIVPEPDRFYIHGAGKPLLPAIISIPQLALVGMVTANGKSLLDYQYTRNYHPIFILTRAAQLLAGLATVLFVYWMLTREYDQDRGLLGAAIVALLPISIKYFPNIHHDSILVPFLVSSLYFFSKEQYRKAGIFLGLALAAKNVSIVMVPILLAYICGNAWRARRSTATSAERAGIQRQMTGFVTSMLLAFLALLPFANPVSYANEILTPITHREFDPRGEHVEDFSVSGGLTKPEATGHNSEIRPEIRFIRKMFRLETNDFFFLIIAVFMFSARRWEPPVRMAFAYLLFALPYCLVFGSEMNYRSLQYVPFFAVVCVGIAEKKHLLRFVAALLVIDVLYCLDPITTNNLHTPATEQALWQIVLNRT